MTNKKIFDIIVYTMYIDSSYLGQKGKIYKRHLLRESYRENGKVKHRTLANLSKCSDEEIKAMKLALKHKENLGVLHNIKDIGVEEGMRIGAVLCLKGIAERVGITQALGNKREGMLALWQVMARIINQGSRLSAVRLGESHAVCDLLGLESFNEDHLYKNLEWLNENQETIEKKFFKIRYKEKPPQLFLYDVTSVYLEGVKNILEAFGYNRDKKEGKKQLVIGLLTDPDGSPVAVRVFEGNTNDNKTVSEQVRILAENFGVKEVTLVGDRGMLKQKQLELLEDKFFHYITAITKPQIRQLMEEGILQLSLFDEQVCEVDFKGIRYILRRNPERAKDIAENRNEKLNVLKIFLDKQNKYLSEHKRAKVEIANKKVNDLAQRLKIDNWAKISICLRNLVLTIDTEVLEEEAELDGCYVLKTDLAKDIASKELIHERYKDLAKVEKAFRTFKNGHLEVRPVYVQTEASTKGHVFVVMLAYIIERELYKCWSSLDVTVSEGIDELGSLRGVVIKFDSAFCQKVPNLTGLSKTLIEKTDIKLPDIIPMRKVHVATRKKIKDQRKNASFTAS